MTPKRSNSPARNSKSPARRSKSPARRSKLKSAKKTNFSVKYMIGHRDFNLITPGTLTVAAYPHFFPVCYKSHGKIQGLDVDLIKSFAKMAKLKVQFVVHNKFDGIWDLPSQNMADCSIGGIANSRGRSKKKTEWSLPYFYVHRSVLFNKNDPIPSFPGGVTKTVVGTAGSTGWIDAQKRMQLSKKTHLLRPGATDEKDLQFLLDGKIQGMMRGDFVSRALIHKHPKELSMITWNAFPELLAKDGEVFAFPCRRASGIAAMLSSFLSILIDSGDIDKLITKYHLN